MTVDSKYMYRALQLAQLQLPLAMPNPSVGAVLVYKDTIIGEGFTAPFGGSHAEVRAIERVQNKALLAQSTLYVTLEPCSHFGKTPPCSLFILQHGIKRVVVGCIDPFSKVSGKGIEQLREHGVEVIVGVLEQECRAVNQRFFTFHLQKRPYVVLKWAMSSDGFIAPLHKNKQKPVWLSNPYSRQLTHKWRTEEQALLVGTQTVLSDNPSLTSRDWFGKHPVRLYIDRTGKVDNSYELTNQKVQTICITHQHPENPLAGIEYEVINFSEPIAHQILNVLYRYQLQSVIIEGGTKTLQQFIDANLWDEARIFQAPILLSKGVQAPKLIHHQLEARYTIDQDQLLMYKNSNYGKRHL